jgi:hypothetical protein
MIALLLFSLGVGLAVGMRARKCGRSATLGIGAAVVYAVAVLLVSTVVMRALMNSQRFEDYARSLSDSAALALMISISLAIHVLLAAVVLVAALKWLSAPKATGRAAGGEAAATAATADPRRAEVLAEKLRRLLAGGVWTDECDRTAAEYAASLAAGGCDRGEIVRRLEELGLSRPGAREIADSL